MSLDSNFYPALTIVIFAVFVGVSAVGWLVQKRAEVASRKQNAAEQARWSSAISALETTVEELRASQEELAQQLQILSPLPRLQPGFNMTKRSQAIRLHRTGSSQQQISSSLGVPLAEIELMLKVHQIALKQAV